MPKQVKFIPAKRDRATFAPLDNPVKRKVAGYARVSTDSEEQLTSYEAQVDYYTKYIKSRSDWEFVLYIRTRESVPQIPSTETASIR